MSKDSVRPQTRENTTKQSSRNNSSGCSTNHVHSAHEKASSTVKVQDACNNSSFVQNTSVDEDKHEEIPCNNISGNAHSHKSHHHRHHHRHSHSNSQLGDEKSHSKSKERGGCCKSSAAEANNHSGVPSCRSLQALSNHQDNVTSCHVEGTNPHSKASSGSHVSSGSGNASSCKASSSESKEGDSGVRDPNSCQAVVDRPRRSSSSSTAKAKENILAETSVHSSQEKSTISSDKEETSISTKSHSSRNSKGKLERSDYSQDRKGSHSGHHHKHHHHHHRHHHHHHGEHSGENCHRRFHRSHSTSSSSSVQSSRADSRSADSMLKRTSTTTSSGLNHAAGSCYPLLSTSTASYSTAAPITTSSSHRTGSIPHPGPVSSQYQEKGDALVAEAEQKLSRSLFRSGDERGALECYQRASAQYKLAGDWSKAGNVLESMAKILKNQGDIMGSGRLYGEAGTCYRKTSTQRAVEAYLRSAEMYVEVGKFGIPAKHHEAIALIYTKDVNPPDYCAVLHHLAIAADFYNSDNRRAARNKCRLEMARLFALTNRFEEAIVIYEELGFESLESRMLKYSADEYLFRAALCHLCIDSVNCEIACKRYVDYYPSFQLSREYKFIQSLCEDIEQENEEGFENTIRKYRSLVSSDSWFLTLLGKIQKHLPDGPQSLR